MIFDITFADFVRLMSGAMIFYQEDDKQIILIKSADGIWLRTSYMKISPEETITFKLTYLNDANSVRAANIEKDTILKIQIA